MNISVGVKVTEKEFNTMSSEIKSDLTSLFNIIEDDLNELLVQAEEEGWTPDQFIMEVENLLS